MSEIEDPVVEEVAADGEETPAEEAARVYAGKFNSDDELEQGYLEAEKAQTQARMEAAELREQIAAYEAAQQEQANTFDPWQALGGSLDEQSEQLWANKLYRDPAATMADALRPESIQQFGPELADRLFVTWQGLQPYQAGMWMAQHGAQSQVAKIEELNQTLAQEQAARQQENAEKASSLAKQMIDNSMPDFTQYKDRVLELFEAYQITDDDPRMQSPEEMAQFTRQMYQIARGEEFDRQQLAAAQEATTEKPAPGAKARTQTRSTAAAGGTSSDPVMQALYDATAAQAQTS